MQNPDALPPAAYTDAETAGEAGPQVHLWDYVQVVLQRLPLALAVFIAGMLLAAVYTWTRPPRFTASARLLVQPGYVNLTDMKGAYDPSVGANQRDFMQTQVQLITSRPVVASALDKADLLSDPGFSESADPIRKLTDEIRVVPLRNTFLIDVSIERQDPEQARRIVNAVLDAFLSENRTRRLGISEGGMAELQTKAEELRAKLDGATREVQDFMIQNQMLSLEKTQNVIVERLRDLSKELTATEPQRMRLQAIVEEADRAIAAGQNIDNLPAVQNSPIVKELKLDTAKLEAEYVNLLQRLGENHPQLQAIITQLDALRTRTAIEAASILASLRLEYEQARKQEELLRQAVAQHETEVFRFNELAAKYSVLKDKEGSIENAYRTIIRRIEEIDISRIGDQGNNTFVIARAMTPTVPSWPQKGKNMVLAFVLSTMLAVGLCFFLDYMDTTIKGEHDVRHLLRCNVLAGIPDTGAEADGRQQSDLVIEEDPKSHAAEAFRALRTSLAFCIPGEPLRSIVVSSTFPEEGKSLVSINLAIAQAQVGRRTLLIDTDMRKPRLHKALSISSSKGMANLLVGNGAVKLDDVIIATSFSNLYFLPCGPVPPNPAELLDSAAFVRVVEEIRDRFDFAVFDAPPSFTLVDSMIMGRRTDGLALVVRSFVTPKHPVNQVVTRIREARIPFLGVVLNNVDLPKGGYYYGSYYYYGRNRYYYADPSEVENRKRGRRGRSGRRGADTPAASAV